MNRVGERDSAQGALEYLMLLAGGVLISTVILLIAINTVPEGNLVLGNAIGTYHSQINLGGGGGFPPIDVLAPVITAFVENPGDNFARINFAGNDPPTPPGPSPPITFTFTRGTDALVTQNVVPFLPPLSSPTPIFAMVFDDVSAVNNTTYYYKMVSCDNVNNCTTTFSGPVTPTNGGTLDNTPPSDVTGLVSANPTGLNVDIVWNPAVDPETGVISYEVRVSNAPIVTNTDYAAATSLGTLPGPLTNFSYTESSMGTFCYAVKAINGVGLFSAGPSTPATLGSDCVTLVTAPTPDTVPPSINYFTVKAKDQRAELTFLATDDPAPPGPSDPVNYTIIVSRNLVAITNIQLTGATNSFDALVSGVAYVNGIHNSSTPALTGTPITQTNLTNGTVFYYRIRACDNALIPNCVDNGSIVSATPTLPTITIALGAPFTVFDYSQPTQTYASPTPSGGCVKSGPTLNWDLPDAYAHAVRNPQNTNEILLYAGNAPDYYVMRGTTFNNLKRDCTAPVLRSTNDKYPTAPNDGASTFNNFEWITSIFSDGSDVHAFIHNEFHDANPAHAPPPSSNPCNGTPNPSNKCWYNSITHGKSSNGMSFIQNNDATDVVAAPPLQWNYSTMKKEPFGYMEPSNVLHVGVYYYIAFAAYTTPGNAGISGLCVMRTTNLNDNTSWRSYNTATQQYDKPLSSPYTSSPSSCTFIPSSSGVWGTLTYNTYFESEGIGPYMIVGTGNLPDPANGGTWTCGFWYQYSSDLITWSVPQLLRATPTTFCGGGSLTNGRAYPSIIDHSDTDPNFQYVDNDAYLYYTQFLGNLTGGNPNRDLLREQLTFTITWP